jgi:hypothetical protein
MEIESHGDAGTMGALEVRKPRTEDSRVASTTVVSEVLTGGRGVVS